MAPKSAGIAKNFFCSKRYWQSGTFFHHPRIERSCPNSRQRLPYAGPGRVSDAAAVIPYDARPSLSAAASAAVTRNVELLSGL
jgi:hypothetical protein